MANDLVIGIGADVGNAVAGLKNVGNGVRDLKNQMETANSQLKKMNWGTMANQLAVGLQDAASVLSNGGSFGMALNAAGNNLIQLATMANPIAGAISAAVIAGAQLAPLFSGAAAEAKKLKAVTDALGGSLKPAFNADPGDERADAARKIQKELLDAERAMERLSAAGVKNNVEIAKWAKLNRSGLGTQVAGTYADYVIKEKSSVQNTLRKLYDEAEATVKEKRLALEVIAPDAIPDIAQQNNKKAKAARDELAKADQEARDKAKDEAEKARDAEIRHLKEVGQEQNAKWAETKKRYTDEQNAIAQLAAQQKAEAEKVQAEKDRLTRNSMMTGRLAGGAVRGSAEEVSLVNRITADSRQNAAMQQLNIQKQQLEEQKKATKAIEQTNANLERGLDFTVLT